MKIIADSDKEVYSARCPQCWSLLAFSRNDVHQPGTVVQLSSDKQHIGGSPTYPFVVCPKCNEIITDIWDLDGVRKISG